MKHRFLSFFSLLILFSGFLLLNDLVFSLPERQPSPESPDRRIVVATDYLGQALIPAGMMFEGTEVGGLSAITYNPDADVYYVLSDDRSELDPARFYSMTIDLSGGFLVNSSVAIQDVTTLMDETGTPFAQRRIDPEGIALADGDILYISSEGDRAVNPPLPPFVAAFGLDGRLIETLPVPDKFLTDGSGSRGVRNNLSFESLTVRPDGRYLFTATENALVQDGPEADIDQPSTSRILRFDRATGASAAEFVYMTEPVAQEPVSADGDRQNGLAEMLALDNNGTFLALERSFSEGMGFTIRLFVVQSQNALDVSSVDSLFPEDGGAPWAVDSPVNKELLIDLSELGLTFKTNFEGMALGPLLPDGRQTLILVADNNFNSFLPSQFIALGLTLETIPSALPVVESPRLLKEPEPPAGEVAGEAADPAIWVHPTEPDNSLVIVAMKDGGLQVLDMAGQALQTIIPEPFGDRALHNVDMLYNFPLAGERVDLAVVSDNANDTLAIYRIDPQQRRLNEVTSDDMPEMIFGVDGGQGAAHGLATYMSPSTGRYYIFVTQENGNRVAQLQLSEDGAGGVSADVVRMIELPIPVGGATDSQPKGIVADRLKGNLFVAMGNDASILKFSAEPDGGNEHSVIRPLDGASPEGGMGGLTIYYGSGTTGYLLAAGRGDHTVAVFERAGDHDYLGRFVVGDNGPIDQVTQLDGADVINAALGPAFPYGLLVVPDGMDEPQNIVNDEGQLSNNSTNFKFVPWEAAAGGFAVPLRIDAEGYNPRYPMRILFPTVSSG